MEESRSDTTVAIFTNFMEFNPGYSLTGIVVDQAHMLAREGHKVLIYVNEQYSKKWEDDCGLTSLKVKYKDLIHVKPITKFMHLTDYSSENDITEEHLKQAEEAAEKFYEDIKKENVSFAFTHDFVFTGWNLPYSLAIRFLDTKFHNENYSIKWFHWIHSIPSVGRDWWDIALYGDKHQLVFPNKTEIMRVAESYKTIPARVEVIPHIKDIRTWYDFGEDAMGLTERYPNIMRADLMQVYPCSTDRLAAKQLDTVIQIFAYVKQLSFNFIPFLIVANQWATGKQRKEDVSIYIERAESLGLKYGQDIIFTSEVDEKYATGISKRMLRELQLLSNVFIFPTREESFGLVGPEASFSGALPVINRSLTMQFEVMSTYCPAFDFGSFHSAVDNATNPAYLKEVTKAILSRVYHNESIMTKLYCKKRYNMDSIYRGYYLPLLIQ